MRFFLAFVAAFAALATAQTSNDYNKINIPSTGLQVTAGQPVTITWSNPSSGTVTIKLQQGAGTTPNSGVTIDTGVQASAGTATFTIDPNSVNTFQYSIEIVDDTNANNINYTPPFGIAGATGSSSTTGSASASTTGSSASASASSASSASTASVSSVSSSASSSSASASSSSARASSASSASSTSATKTSSSATAASSTSAPTGNSAASYKSQSGLLIAVIGALAVF